MTEKIKNIYSIANGKTLELPVRLTKSDGSSCITPCNLDRISWFLAELLGTGMLVFLGCSGCILGWGVVPTRFMICFNFGLAVMLIVNVFGHISGAHLNPAVTIAATIYKLVNPSTAAIYIIGQVLGAFMGFGLLKALTPAQIFRPSNETSSGLCTTVPHPDISSIQAVAVEFIITSILIFICCAVWDPRNAKSHDSVPLRFGLAITCLALSGGPFSGGSMNPARSLGPALWNGDFDSHWIYWVGPILAAVVVTPFYNIIFKRDASPAETHEKTIGEEFPLSRTNNA
ncbi:aquaporin [Sergentomyia squamirostris]